MSGVRRCQGERPRITPGQVYHCHRRRRAKRPCQAPCRLGRTRGVLDIKFGRGRDSTRISGSASPLEEVEGSVPAGGSAGGRLSSRFPFPRSVHQGGQFVEPCHQRGRGEGHPRRAAFLAGYSRTLEEQHADNGFGSCLVAAGEERHGHGHLTNCPATEHEHR